MVALKGRSSWKPARHLPLACPSFDHTALTTFRTSLRTRQSEGGWTLTRELARWSVSSRMRWIGWSCAIFECT